MRLQKAVALCGTFILVLVVSGCASLRKTPPEPAVTSVPAKAGEKHVIPQKPFTSSPVPAWRDSQSQFEDIPIPPDSVYVDDESYVHTEHGLRIAELKYKVEKASTADVFKFFRERMPGSNWIFKRICGLRMKSLVFVKGREECVVKVGGEDEITIIRINVHERVD